MNEWFPIKLSQSSASTAPQLSLSVVIFMFLVAISGREIVPISHGQLAEMSSEDEEERSWSEKVSNGILIGAKWVSWGLSKGAELSSHYVEKVSYSHSSKQLKISLIRF